MTNSETVAKALEISISLTKNANHTWIRTDDRGFVFLKEPLFTTLQNVIRVMNSDVANLSGDLRAFPEREKGSATT